MMEKERCLVDEIRDLEKAVDEEIRARQTRLRACKVYLCPICRSKKDLVIKYPILGFGDPKAKCNACGYKETFPFGS